MPLGVSLSRLGKSLNICTAKAMYTKTYPLKILLDFLIASKKGNECPGTEGFLQTMHCNCIENVMWHSNRLHDCVSLAFTMAIFLHQGTMPWPALFCSKLSQINSQIADKQLHRYSTIIMEGPSDFWFCMAWSRWINWIWKKSLK